MYIYIYLYIQNTEVLVESSLLLISAMLYQILALFGNWIDFNFRSSLDIVVYVSLRMFNLYKIVISWFSIILVLRSRH
jgi:ABC-type tungstate transport system permease subunit